MHAYALLLPLLAPLALASDYDLGGMGVANLALRTADAADTLDGRGFSPAPTAAPVPALFERQANNDLCGFISVSSQSASPEPWPPAQSQRLTPPSGLCDLRPWLLRSRAGGQARRLLPPLDRRGRQYALHVVRLPRVVHRPRAGQYRVLAVLLPQQHPRLVRLPLAP